MVDHVDTKKGGSGKVWSVLCVCLSHIERTERNGAINRGL